MPSDAKFDSTIFPLSTQPGIKRDGTDLDGNFYADGQWCRFRIGRPKKIGGFREITNGLNGPIRGIYTYSKYPLHVIYNFSGTGIQCVTCDNNGVGSLSYDRTPGAPFVADPNLLYQYDVMFDATGGDATIIVHPCPNLTDIGQSTATDVYYGPVLATTPLVQVNQQVSGGCVVLQPSLFLYGDNGLILNSNANKPNDFTIGTGIASSANVAATKIVKGLALRGGSASPAGLFWSLDALIRVTFIGGTAKWQYDTLTTQSSIICSNSVIDYDGVYYWIGIDRFLMYNGVVKEVPNFMNQDFFFNNVNWSATQKIWVTKVPKYGEIWWFFPRGTATECNWAIIYNVRENSWYDTPITRSAGAPPRVLPFPIWADSSSNSDVSPNTYRTYRQEFGVDSIKGSTQTAIESYFTTSQIGFATGGADGSGMQNPNVNTRIVRIEPDFVQVGGMTVQPLGATNAQVAMTPLGQVETFTPTTPFVDVYQQSRLLQLKFDSNILGGDYQMGKTLIHMETGDQRQS